MLGHFMMPLLLILLVPRSAYLVLKYKNNKQMYVSKRNEEVIGLKALGECCGV